MAKNKNTSDTVATTEERQVKRNKRLSQSKVQIPVIPSPLTVTPTIRKSLIAITVFFVVLLLWFYTQRPGSVSGKVITDQSPAILRNAQVSLDQSQAVTISDLTGTFIFADINRGKHVLTVKAPGYEDKTVNFELKSPQQLNLTVKLKKLPEADPMAGKLLFLASRDPNQIDIKDSNFNTLKTILLEGRPSALLFQDGQLFVAEQDKNQISIWDIRQAKKINSIALDPNSEPVKLLLDNENKLLVLNRIGENISVINLDNLAITQRIDLPVSASDMIFTSNGNQIMVSTYGNLYPVSYPAGDLGQAISVSNDLNTKLYLDSNNQNVFFAHNKNVSILNATSLSLETHELSDKINAFYPMGESLVIAGQEQLSRYLLNTKTSEPISVDVESKSVQDIVLWDANKILFLTKEPAELHLLNLNGFIDELSVPYKGRLQTVGVYSLN